MLTDEQIQEVLQKLAPAWWDVPQGATEAFARAMLAASPADQDAVIFAWATFDGEGGYDLRLFEGNGSYRRDYINRNGAKYADWVIPLYRTMSATPPAAES